MPALGLFVYAGVTDLVDGWIARKWGLQTVLGTVIDPMADKALMTVVTVTLAMKGALPSEWSHFLILRIAFGFYMNPRANGPESPGIEYRPTEALLQYPSLSSS